MPIQIIFLNRRHLGRVWISICRLARIGTPIIRIRRSHGRLIFTTEKQQKRLSLYWDRALVISSAPSNICDWITHLLQGCFNGFYGWFNKPCRIRVNCITGISVMVFQIAGNSTFFISLFKLTPKKTSKSTSLWFYEEKPPAYAFPSHRASNWESMSMSWAPFY